jgi:hypothetical protein
VNLKRWFAWLCLALMLVAEIFLFRANRQAVTAQTDLRAAQSELRQANEELAALKSSDAGSQVLEIARLRKQNDLLTQKNATLQADADALREQNQQTTEHLTTARTALQLQQDHLRELATESEQVQTAAEQKISAANRSLCLGNLRQIDAAKQQWALENDKTIDSVPTAVELLPYFKDLNFPVCPAGGTYTINAVGVLPSCSIIGHQLP